ncbi:MAG: PP2C family protein-serine/threonine phosphatase [bacterium]|nr:PP2C family protein-serine/threonine phosphatase [bacterium]
MSTRKVEEKKVTSLKRQLKLKEFQFNSIFEFSDSIYSSFNLEGVIRIHFSTLMGHLGVLRIFFSDSQHGFFKNRGFKPSDEELELYNNNISKLGSDWFSLKVEEFGPELAELKELLSQKKISYLVNISESDERRAILGLGSKLKGQELSMENIEYAFLVSKFSLSAIDNAVLISRLIESKRMEHEIKIAKDIQLGLLPQSLPKLENFEMSVIYQPINDVGGDYYDVLKEWKGCLPVLIADVEGKGLSAALLAASSQAVFHALNELYFSEPGEFISKANAMIYDFTHGKRFITLFWMLVNDAEKTVTYVNAGHASPFLVRNETLTPLTKGGFLTGFVEEAQYDNETLSLQSGDIIIAFTDGVPEVENPEGEEYGEDAVIEYIKEHRHLNAEELTQSLYKTINDFSQGTKFRDDFTLLILKVK